MQGVRFHELTGTEEPLTKNHQAISCGHSDIICVNLGMGSPLSPPLSAQSDLDAQKQCDDGDVDKSRA
jgi:hypothetical protein